MTNSDSMNAIVINEYGDESKLTEQSIPVPDIHPNQVLVKVVSIGVNPIDWKTRSGLRQERYPFKFPIVLGQEMAGIVSQVGSQVSGFKPGDAVVGYGTPSNRGTYAEFYAVDADKLAHKPITVSFQAAAGLSLAGTTAWEALFDAGQLKRGQTVLILAGSGGVGGMAIQLAKNAGAHVLTTTSSPNVSFVTQLGADKVIDYTQANFADQVKNVDLVFDTLGGQNQLDAFKVVKPGGRIISIVETLPETTELGKQHDVYFEKINAAPRHEIISQLSAQLGAGKLKIKIAKQLPFTVENVQAMHRQSETGHVVGKLILNV
ncbi:NADP-dependent oxidoreductase [Lentilactobacillus sp. IMAU92037]|uniref:NADP-dependent oxidoreductase n=1 Tax=Lentilactobacillus TaxID=2767893 RepID=UPI001C270C36|nr:MULTISPECIES: NADP-dependent oxidoreductase [Lentilactobacillus]MBU9789851.1 NADP-dependent oxidoreductase [Lentilactobacillus dabitei]MBV0930335.1 NADP-dependent oxidoreductase [Lentilactobacillus dabitei]MDM7517101.1 NADP-dependent oxidoreductase [Lentilactobacillus sp. TOM.63]